MCGILGYIGKEKAAPILINGLKKLEYRGYDSAGIATLDGKNTIVEKDIGKVEDFEKKIDVSKINGNIGISHCRWATHGSVTKENAHPHFDSEKEIFVVHNGIIENYQKLKDELIKKGYKFSSQTDTEVIPHLIKENYSGKIEEAVRKTLQEIEGSYAIAVICKKEPDKIIAARNESPLIIGKGKDCMFVASDVPAILDYTRDIVYLDDKEIAVITESGFEVSNLEGKRLAKKITRINWNAEDAEKSGYKHFMLKEIYEQPKAITDTLNGRLVNGDVFFEDDFKISDEELKRISRIIIVACGTSWHSGLVGEFMFEELAKIPTEVEYGSEFRYRHPLMDKDTLVIAISQSGETADTLAALKEAKNFGVKTLAICNVIGSSLSRIADNVIYTRAGPEIGVASTKAFTTQLAVIYLLTIKLSKIRGTLNDKQISDMISGIRKIPLEIQSVLDEDSEILKCAELYYEKTNSIYLGRGVNFPIALEGALKLKEVSYIHAEGYPAAEMKHGPIALIDKNMPVVFIAPKDIFTYHKVLGNIEEVKARGGIVISIATEGDNEILKKSKHTLFIPKSLYTLSSILSVVPLQLLAYHIAVRRGFNPDKPRNLAKAVTVE